MIRDSFYIEIINRLAVNLDGDIFEECANALLRKDFPDLVPIRGGTDSGMDGVTASPGPFLVCTTHKNVIGNLTGSLHSHLRSDSPRRRAILATSQKLTQKKRANLERRVRELGFHLIQIYDRAALADRLYYEPDWCKELLGLTGRPSALTAIPRTERPLLDHPLVGRAPDVIWLKESTGDRLIVGSPGCGKTFLLRTLALDGWGLFLVDADKTAIANAIRSQQPSVIIVDDAHSQIEVLSMLRQLRSEINAEFDIVATSWEGDKDLVAEALALPASHIRELNLLTRDEIVQVVKHAGIGGPVQLVREMVNQAEGRPGLAITLAYLCLNGGVREVFWGEALNRSLGTTIQKLVGREAKDILGAFAIAGDAGMPMEAVAASLGLSIVQLRTSLIRLAAGGVLRESYQKNLSVWPRPLRYILVRDTFFSGQCDLSSTTLMKDAPDQSQMAQTLVEAKRRGANIPDLVNILESVRSPAAWSDYATLGKNESEYVLQQHPDLLPDMGRETLFTAPQATLPLLLAAAIGDERPLPSTLNHPLRWVQDWVREAMPGNSETLSRRQVLLDSVIKWITSGGDEQVALKAISLAFIPSFETNSSDPGSGMIATITSGLLSFEELSQVRDLWPKACEVLERIHIQRWEAIFHIMNLWAYPSLSNRNHNVADDIRQLMRSTTLQMLRSVSLISRDRPSIQQWVRRFATNLNLEVETHSDEEFEVLFPEIPRNDWEAVQEKQRQRALALADKWRYRKPSEVASRLIYLTNEALLAGKHGPAWTQFLCEQIASHVQDLSHWLDEFLKAGVSADLVHPFLYKAATTQTASWGERLTSCLEDPNYFRLAASIILSLSDVPNSLLNLTLEKVENHSDLVMLLCLRRQIPDRTLLLLLGHNKTSVSIAAAVGEWAAGPKGQVRAAILPEWKKAILRANGDEDAVSEILKSDRLIAFEWLMARANNRFYIASLQMFETVESVFEVLDFDQKLLVLNNAQNIIQDSMLVAKLVGDDLKLYTELLKQQQMAQYHLAPLVGHPVGSWKGKALIALDSGYSPEQVAEAAFPFYIHWVDSEAAMWQQWVGEFEELKNHTDPRIQAVGERGAAHARSKAQTAARRERKEAVYGR